MEEQGEVTTIFRKCASGDWMELQNETITIVALSGIVIRDRVSKGLISDFPASAINSIEKVNEIMSVINAEGCRIGLKFENPSAASRFLGRAETSQIRVTESEPSGQNPANEKPFTMPQLTDPSVQEFILKLLFSDEFKGFVGDLKQLLRNMEENVALQP